MVETTLRPKHPIQGWSEKKKFMACHDCSAMSEDYMVTKAVWDEAWPEYRKLRPKLHAEARQKADPDGMRKYDPEGFKKRLREHEVFLLLCFCCLEKRLGRNLQSTDFTDVPINRPIFLGTKIS